ncbi:MAG: Glycine-rich cell wall structural protein 1 precursor [Myxococcaceae bacterium]|nr:Glycine-rich cell wall structural protein 1 precursor [Myxococcaceae bacterium]
MIAAGTAASLLLAVSGCGAELRPAASTRSSIAPDGGLARAAVDDAIRTHVPALRACYEKFAAAEGRPMGVVRFGWRIDPSGAVSSVAIVATTLHSAAIEGCIADEVARWRFPAAARETEVTEHPFSF